MRNLSLAVLFCTILVGTLLAGSSPNKDISYTGSPEDVQKERQIDTQIEEDRQETTRRENQEVERRLEDQRIQDQRIQDQRIQDQKDEQRRLDRQRD